MWPFSHENDPGGTGRAGSLLGMACATLLVFALVQAPPDGGVRPTRRDIAPLEPRHCAAAIDRVLAAARRSQTPIWMWVDQAIPIPRGGSHEVADRLGYERPSPTPPAPYAFPDDAVPPFQLCRFEQNAVHVLVRGEGAALPPAAAKPRNPRPGGEPR